LWRRIKQLAKALFPRIDVDDHEFVSRYCLPPLGMLFYQMDVVDQRHCIDVARTAHRMGRLAGLGTSLDILVPAALLHDVGKVRGDLSLWQRVLLSFYDGEGLERLMARGGRLGAGARVQLQHPRRGAHMAELFGAPAPVVYLIRWHHDPSRAEENRLLAIMQAADENN
jgi:putative nucleotidyltransferase with HDIG domain